MRPLHLSKERAANTINAVKTRTLAGNGQVEEDSKRGDAGRNLRLHQHRQPWDCACVHKRFPGDVCRSFGKRQVDEQAGYLPKPFKSSEVKGMRISVQNDDAWVR